MSSKTKTTATKDDATPALVPKLRFPEFRGAEGWDVEFLGGICQPQQWTTISSTDLVDVGFPVYGANGLIGYYSDFNHEFETVAVTCRGSTCGEVSLIPPKSYVTGNSMCLDGIDATRNSHHFLYHLLRHRGFDDVISGSAQPQIVGNAIKRLRIALPAKSEQKKIAECLSSVDELIAAQARKVDTLKTHKKGLMQQLFPREGETQPRFRFPEFQNAGEWEETELGQLISIKGRIGYRGYTVADIVSAEEGAISLSPSNITESGVLGFAKATYISWAKYHESPEIMVEREQTLLVKTGSTFGKAAYVWDLPQECTVNPQIVVLKPSSIHPYFLFLLVFGEVIQTKIRAIVVGGAIPTLSQEAVSKFMIRVPTNAEQQRIASCLSSLDALITAKTKKLEALKTHKKGLMQQLFPSPETEA